MSNAVSLSSFCKLPSWEAITCKWVRKKRISATDCHGQPKHDNIMIIEFRPPQTTPYHCSRTYKTHKLWDFSRTHETSDNSRTTQQRQFDARLPKYRTDQRLRETCYHLPHHIVLAIRSVVQSHGVQQFCNRGWRENLPTVFQSRKENSRVRAIEGGKIEREVMYKMTHLGAPFWC